jgi:hypothetical protein
MASNVARTSSSRPIWRWPACAWTTITLTKRGSIRVRRVGVDRDDERGEEARYLASFEDERLGLDGRSASANQYDVQAEHLDPRPLSSARTQA